MKNIKKFSLVGVPTVIIAVIAIVSTIGGSSFPAKAYAQYTEKLQNSVLYQKIKITKGADSDRYFEKINSLFDGFETDFAEDDFGSDNEIMESWSTDTSLLTKIGESYTLAVGSIEGEEAAYYADKKMFDLDLEFSGEELDGAMEGEISGTIIIPSFAGHEGDEEDAQIMQLMEEIDTQNLLNKLQQAASNKNVKRLAETVENGRTLVGFEVKIPAPNMEAVEELIREQLPKGPDGEDADVFFPESDEQNISAMYFDKETGELVKQIDIMIIDDERFEISESRVIEEKWIPNEEVGDLFNPEKYELEKVE